MIAVSSRVTDKAGATRRLVFGIAGQPGALTLLKDWEVLRALNGCTLKAEPAPALEERAIRTQAWLAHSAVAAAELLRQVELPFSSLHIAELALLWTDT